MRHESTLRSATLRGTGRANAWFALSSDFRTGVPRIIPARVAQKYPVLLFCLLAYTLSWSYWLMLLLCGYRVEPGSSTTHLPGLFGPFLAALIVTGFADGLGGLRFFLGKCLRLPAPRLIWLVFACSPALIGAAIFATTAALGGRIPDLREFNSYPGTPDHWPFLAQVAFVFVLNGLGEEGGWRGFALPRLLQGRSKLWACMHLTAIWLIWHAPLFFLSTSMSALLGPMLIGWILGLTAGSLVLAWLYMRSQSILVVSLWHTAFNFVVATVPGRGGVAAAASTIVMFLGLVIARVWWREPGGGDA